MGADHLPLVEQRFEVSGVGMCRPAGDRPGSLARVLGLDGKQTPDHRGRRPGVRHHKLLAA
jgi:hypothetical protein